MNRIKWTLLIGICTLSFGVVSGQDAIQELFLLEPAKPIRDESVHKAAESDSIKNDDGGFKADERVVDCFASMEYLSGGLRGSSKPVSFRLLMPTSCEAGKKYPLVLLLHGRGESGTDNRRQLAHLQTAIEFLGGKNKLDFFLLAPQCPDREKLWLDPLGEGEPSALQIASSILNAVIKEYPVDENAVSIFGISSGAVAAWELAAESPERFAALAICSGAPPAVVKPEVFKSIVIRAYNNRGDVNTPFENTASFIRQINAAGGNAALSLDNIGGHDTWTRAFQDDQIFLWLIQQNRTAIPQRQNNETPPVSESAEGSKKKIHLLEPGSSSRFSIFPSQKTPKADKNGKPLPSQSVVDLFSIMEYRYTGGRYHDTPILFRLFSPKTIAPGKRYPLVLWFHDQSESGNDNKRQLAHLEKNISLMKGIGHLDFYLLALQCPEDNSRWIRPVARQDERDLPIVILGEIAETMLREFPIDENRVSLLGIGNGADALWAFIERYPGMAAAYAPCAGGIPQQVPDACLQPALWMLMPTETGVKPYGVELLIAEINENGGNARADLYFPKNTDLWTGPLNDKKIIGWLISQDRRLGGPPQGLVCDHRGPIRQFILFGLPLILLGLLYYKRRNHKATDKKP